MKKKGAFVPVGNTNWNKRVRQPRGRWLHLLSRLVLPTGTKCLLLSRLPDPGQKGTPFCPGLAFPVGKPGQINVFVVVAVPLAYQCIIQRWSNIFLDQTRCRVFFFDRRLDVELWIKINSYTLWTMRFYRTYECVPQTSYVNCIVRYLVRHNPVNISYLLSVIWFL